MNRNLKFLSLLLFLGLGTLYSCQEAGSGSLDTKTKTDANGYTYEYVEGDESDTRIYTLENGLKVYLSVNEGEPRIQAYLPVKAGGKFDPAESTGLAHYLEHMMFKGNDKFGTKDYEAEKVLLDSIETLFQQYRDIEDEAARKAHYAIIDEVSNKASEYAIANEYDKMMAFIGAKGTNAYTTEDRTVYTENIPSNQLENFLQIQSVRFSKIVNRLFHTELEAVYEEKNRSLDNDNWQAYEAMYKELFKKHPYGTQTVIGTINHLKNPSITDIKDYFSKYYVPNNMAVCLAGELDPEQTIQLVDEYFGELKPGDVPEFEAPEEDPKTEVSEVTVTGPSPASVNVGFRMGGTSSEDMPYLQIIDYMLNNSTAGLIDLNLVQQQKVLGAGTYVQNMNDYSIHTFYGRPREGQSLEEVKDLVLGQLELIKQGEFEDWLLEAVVNDLKKNKMSALESNYARANDMVMAFTNDMAWEDYIGRINAMEALTKEDIVNFANEHYQQNYAVVYKEFGEKEEKQKVEKPSITKVQLDRSSQSDFFEEVAAREVPAIEPRFLDYEEDIQTAEIEPGIPVLYNQNESNELFTLYYLLEYGTNEQPVVEYALDYLQYLGTADKSAEEVKKEFYRLGANFNVNSTNERIYVTLTGLSENMEPAMQLFESLINEPQGASEEVLANMISDKHKERSDNKKSKSTILFQGLMNYAMYGEESPFTNVLSNEELDALNSDELISIIQSIPQTEHKIMYYGPESLETVTRVLQKNHRTREELQAAPERRQFARLDPAEEGPQVFYTNYDMVQAEVIFQRPGVEYDPTLAPAQTLFNEYFGGGMGSIVFQEIREAQGLAYSVFSSYNQASKIGERDQMMAYVGTQADKQDEAMDAMVDLLNNLPESEEAFQNAKKSIIEKINSERITKASVFFNYLSAKNRGLDYDIREKIYERVKEMTFADIKAFHEEYIKDKQYNVAIIGDRERLDFVALLDYGAVQELSLDEVFGYKEKDSDLLN